MAPPQPATASAPGRPVASAPGTPVAAAPRPRRASEGALQVLECDQPPAAVHRDPDRVEADDVGVGPVPPLHQPASGHLADLDLLGAPHRVKRPTGAAARTPRLQLAESEGAAGARHDVQLAPSRPVVALNDLIAEPQQVRGGQLLAGTAQFVFLVISHARNAT